MLTEVLVLFNPAMEARPGSLGLATLDRVFGPTGWRSAPDSCSVSEF